MREGVGKGKKSWPLPFIYLSTLCPFIPLKDFVTKTLTLLRLPTRLSCAFDSLSRLTTRGSFPLTIFSAVHTFLDFIHSLFIYLCRSLKPLAVVSTAVVVVLVATYATSFVSSALRFGSESSVLRYSLVVFVVRKSERTAASRRKAGEFFSPILSFYSQITRARTRASTKTFGFFVKHNFSFV